MFYVYEWYNTNTEEIFYVGKGTRNRYKQISGRNYLFKNYYENNDCAVRIIKFFDQESDAFAYEHERIIELKKNGQCFCNLDNGGTGGVNFIWTEEMRAYKSVYNPMKDELIAKKVGIKHRKIVIYQGKETTCQEIAQRTGMHVATIQNWCKRGYDTDGNSCYYKENYISANKKTTNSKGVLIDGQFFPSLRAACCFLGIKDTSPLCRALKSGKKYKGHFCEYANQQPSEMNS